MEIEIVRTKIETVKLELSEQEARWLATVCCCIGGPTSGPRGMFDKILRYLHNEGIVGIVDLLEPDRASIYFKDDIK